MILWCCNNLDSSGLKEAAIKGLTKLCKEAGVQKVTPHELRHSCTEVLFSHGARPIPFTIKTLQKSLKQTIMLVYKFWVGIIEIFTKLWVCLKPDWESFETNKLLDRAYRGWLETEVIRLNKEQRDIEFSLSTFEKQKSEIKNKRILKEYSADLKPFLTESFDKLPKITKKAIFEKSLAIFL